MNEIILSGIENPLVKLSNNIIERQNHLCALAEKITKVSSQQDQEDAVDIAAQIKAFMNNVEAERKELKKPVIDMGKMLDDKIKAFIEKSELAYSSLTKAISVWQESERIREARIREEEEKKRVEALRLVAEQEAALHKKIQEARSEMAKEALEIELEKKNQEFRDTIIESHAAVAVAAPERPKGVSVTKSYDFEVLNIHEVYKHNSALVKLEANKVVIKSMLRQGMTTCPGLKIFEAKTEVNIRAAK